MDNIILCDRCIRTFGKEIAHHAECKATKKSILIPDRVQVLYLCYEHSMDAYCNGWEIVDLD